MKRLLGLALLLAACSEQSAGQVSADLLEPILVKQPGDLPARYQGGQVTSLPREDGDFAYYADISSEARVFVMQVLETGNPVGAVAVFVFDEPNQALASIDPLVDGDTQEPVLGLGETAVATYGEFYNGLVFTRCTTTINIQILGGNLDVLKAYAVRLDERITELVCN